MNIINAPGDVYPSYSSVVTLARDRLKFIYSKSAYFFESADYNGTPFPQILLDLSRYECEQLVQSSMHLLNRYYSSELSLFKKGVQTQLLVTEESKKVFNEVGELVPTLRRYMSIDVEEKERATIIKILQTFSAMCTLQGDESEAHQQNQKILYNYGEINANVSLYSLITENAYISLCSLTDNANVSLCSLTDNANVSLYSLTDNAYISLYSLTDNANVSLYSLTENANVSLCSLTDNANVSLYSLTDNAYISSVAITLFLQAFFRTS